MAIYRTAAFAAALLVAVPMAHADEARWTVDRAHSTLGFSGTQTGTKFQGRFSRFEAQITLDPDHPESAQIKATIDLASAETGDPQRDTALPGRDWFDVAGHAQAAFETSAIRKTGANAYEAVGTLTLRGVVKPVTLHFTLEVTGNTAHARGQATLVRTEFGVGQGAWASGKWVAMEVGVNLDLTATRAN